jgi:hypothetical protein
MNNKEETTPIKNQDTKIDTQENNGIVPNVEKNLENNSEVNL